MDHMNLVGRVAWGAVISMVLMVGQGCAKPAPKALACPAQAADTEAASNSESDALPPAASTPAASPAPPSAAPACQPAAESLAALAQVLRHGDACANKKSLAEALALANKADLSPDVGQCAVDGIRWRAAVAYLTSAKSVLDSACKKKKGVESAAGFVRDAIAALRSVDADANVVVK